MQIRSMQAVAPAERQHPRPPTFSSLKSKNSGTVKSESGNNADLADQLFKGETNT